MTNREKRPSEKIVDTIYSCIRNVDVLVWNGQPANITDLEEYTKSIKYHLDEMLSQYKTEVGYSPVVNQNPTMFIDPPHKTSDWYATPLIKNERQKE